MQYYHSIVYVSFKVKRSICQRNISEYFVCLFGGVGHKEKRIKVDSLCVPIGILLVYMLNMALYQGRSVLFETPGDGFTTVLQYTMEFLDISYFGI